MEPIAPGLEAVYYGSPIPQGMRSLTPLGLVFDRIHFPNVHLPVEGYDPEAVAAEAVRIERVVKRMDYNTANLVGALRVLPHVPDLKEFCVFSGDERQMFGGPDDKATDELVKALDEQIFGPPKDGFTPTYETGVLKGLPGGSASIDYPGALHYPAKAILYAAKMGLPIVNDNPELPVPALGATDAKHNAKLLASILAMECVNFALPDIPPLSPKALVALRAELKPQLLPFRTSVLKLTKELNLAISQNAEYGEIVSAAKFLVETDIAPAIAELTNALSKPTKGWTARGFEFVKQAPELVTAFASMPTELAVAKALAAVGAVFVNLDANSAKREATRSGMYYLLRLRQLNA